MHLAADLRTLSVRACFAGASPERLRAGDDAAARYLIETRWDDETSPAARVRGDTAALIEQAGFYEYFCPITGRGAGGGDFTWTAATWLAWASPKHATASA